MIQLALRSSAHADEPLAATRSARIEGSATAVIINSRPARKTPVPNTASRTSAERRSIRPSVSVIAVDARAGRRRQGRRRLGAPALPTPQEGHRSMDRTLAPGQDDAPPVLTDPLPIPSAPSGAHRALALVAAIS